MPIIDSLAQAVNAITDPVSGFIWGYVLTYLLLGAGLLFTLATRGLPLRLLGHMTTLVFTQKGSGKGVSSFQALSTSLAARVGTGNLAGVALALFVGGPGAIFWMWMTALVGISTTFIECTLGQVYKVRHRDGVYRGGPAYYIERALGQRCRPTTSSAPWGSAGWACCSRCSW